VTASNPASAIQWSPAALVVPMSEILISSRARQPPPWMASTISLRSSKEKAYTMNWAFGLMMGVYGATASMTSRQNFFVPSMAP